MYLLISSIKKSAETVSTWKRYRNVAARIPVCGVAFPWHAVVHQRHHSHSCLWITSRLRLPGFIMRISSGPSWFEPWAWLLEITLLVRRAEFGRITLFASLRGKHIWKKNHGSVSHSFAHLFQCHSRAAVTVVLYQLDECCHSRFVSTSFRRI